MVPSETSPESFTSLREVLRARRTAAIIADAELIRDAPKNNERDDEAQRAVRETMLLFALHRITREQRNRILEILSFAIPDPSAEVDLPQDPDGDSPTPHGPVA
jgi:hypothetical protein